MTFADRQPELYARALETPWRCFRCDQWFEGAPPVPGTRPADPPRCLYPDAACNGSTQEATA